MNSGTFRRGDLFLVSLRATETNTAFKGCLHICVQLNGDVQDVRSKLKETALQRVHEETVRILHLRWTFSVEKSVTISHTIAN